MEFSGIGRQTIIAYSPGASPRSVTGPVGASMTSCAPYAMVAYPALAEIAPKIGGDGGVVGDEDVADQAGEPFVGQQDALLRESPAPPGPLHPVHVDDVRYAAHAGEHVVDAGVVAEGEPYVFGLAHRHRMPNRLGIERCGATPTGLGFPDLDALEAVPLVDFDRTVSVELAVDDHPPAPLAQIQADVLGGRLEAAVGSGDAVCPEDADGRNRTDRACVSGRRLRPNRTRCHQCVHRRAALLPVGTMDSIAETASAA